ncbi:MAG: radical SAM protein [Thermodesulfobacteriota bacterium]
MFTGIHFLLTYTCLFECDHCFLYCGPGAEGVFTLSRIKGVLEEARRMGTVEWIYFEGGEPFLYYPVMLEGLRSARAMGFYTGVVSNGYWATTREDAAAWLKPLRDLGVADLSLSDDAYHFGEEQETPARTALAAALDLGLEAMTICIDHPRVTPGPAGKGEKGEPIVGGGVKFRGRAADKLSEGLPRRRWSSLVECPHEDLRDPGRVHVDPFGHVFICQGLSLGNFLQAPLSDLLGNYDPSTHPVCGPLAEGGPARLVERYGLLHEEGYVDECHLCFEARRELIGRFPEFLAPGQVYGRANTG